MPDANRSEIAQLAINAQAILAELQANNLFVVPTYPDNIKEKA
jgi:hypothetical protein